MSAGWGEISNISEYVSVYKLYIVSIVRIII